MSKHFPRFLAIAFSLLLLLQASPGFAEEAAKGGVSPTTGLPTDKPYRPVLVQIGNDWGGRPAYNLSEADIVYEFVIWGPGHTRYLALYNDQHPSIVLPIRSARANSIKIREEWDCPIVLWGGMNHADYQDLRETLRTRRQQPRLVIFDGTGNLGSRPSDVLFRAEERMIPHNAAVNLKKLVEEHWPSQAAMSDDSVLQPAGDIAKSDPYKPRLPALQFSDTPVTGDARAVKITIAYDTTNNYVPEYTYNEETRLYERWYCGEKQIDGNSGKRIAASNVIVQYAHVEYYKNDLSHPIVQTTGEGIIHAFIDGWHYTGTWKRHTLDDQTEYLDANGDPLVLMPGKTFIQVVPPDLRISSSVAETGAVEYTFSLPEQ